MKNLVFEKLNEAKDEGYLDFQSKLVPEIDKERIIGVRTPDMRRIAKEMNGTEEGEAFLKKLPHSFYEENLVHFFMIALIKDFDRCVKETERFLPYVDCWPVSDQATPKAFSKNHEKLLPYIKKWIASDHVYTVRFGMRMLMNEFLGSDFKPEYPELVAAKRSEEYYLNMMSAWYFATALAKNYDECIGFIEQHKLSTWVHNKAIQKALESYRVSDEHKEYLRTLKIK